MGTITAVIKFLESNQGMVDIGIVFTAVAAILTIVGNALKFLFKSKPQSKLFQVGELLTGWAIDLPQVWSAIKAILGKLPVEPAVKALAGLTLVGALLMPKHAQAASLGPVDVSWGPSLGFLEYAPSNPHPTSVANGAGMMVSFSLPQLQMNILGKSYNMLGLSLIALGSVVSGPTSSYGQLQLVAALTTLSSLLGLGYGHAILDNSGAFPSGGGFLAVIGSLNFTFDASPATESVQKGSAVLKGNTLYLGSIL